LSASRTDVVFSGANLSESYLTIRQDRYVVRNAPALSDWVEFGCQP